jgi:hypothetical protein
MTAYAIKAEVEDTGLPAFDFPRQKTMYGGRRIAAGDEIYIFASEIGGGPGLVAFGIVTEALPVARSSGAQPQTPRVSIRVRRVALAQRRLDRAALKGWCQWDDGRPETELNFKFYRQATNKIAAISDTTAAFLRGFFEM